MSEIINGVGKWCFRVPRPYWVDDGVLAKAQSHEYSFPSSHSQIVWALATFFNNTRKWGAAQLGAFATCVSLSRVYEGVHYPRDIICGGVAGIVLARTHMVLQPRFVAALKAKSFATKLGCLQIFTALFAVLLWWGHRQASGHQPKPEWVERVRKNRRGKQQELTPVDVPLQSYVGMLGVLSGLSTVAAVGFDKSTPHHMRLPRSRQALLARFFLGQATLLASFFGIRAATPKSPGTLNFLLRFLRYKYVPIHIVLVAPKLFKVLGI